MYDLIIIGAGPAGLYAATSAAMHKLNACIIESAYEFGGTLNLYKQKMVYDMPGFVKISAGDLIDHLYQQYKPYESEVKMFLNCKATEINTLDTHYELVTNQGTFKTKTILLANGGGMFEPRLLELEGADAKSNIYYNVKDVSYFKDQELVVLGGGDSAVDWALTLSEVAKKVTLVHRRPDFRAHEVNVEKIREIGTVLTPYTPEALVGYDKVDYLTLKHTENQSQIELKLDALFVFYGSNPAKTSMDKWGLDVENNLIKVASDMQTSKKGIYAIGNSVTYLGKRKMIVTGLGEAATAISAISQYLYPEKTITYKH